MIRHVASSIFLLRALLDRAARMIGDVQATRYDGTWEGELLEVHGEVCWRISLTLSFAGARGTGRGLMRSTFFPEQPPVEVTAEATAARRRSAPAAGRARALQRGRVLGAPARADRRCGRADAARRGRLLRGAGALRGR